MRLFIACPLEENIIQELGALQEKLKNATEKTKIKWVAPEKIHLTLKFLGETAPRKCSRIAEILNSALKSFDSYEIEVKDGGVFPSPSRPRVLWVGCGDSFGRTAKLQKKIETDLCAIGFRKEKRKFIPHLTIGRIKYTSGRSRVTEKLISDKIYLGKMTVSQLNLYESRLKPSGAEYKVIEKIVL